MVKLISNPRDYMAAMQLMEEYSKQDSYDEGEIEFAREISRAMSDYEEELGDALASHLGTDECYALSERIFDTLYYGDNDDYDTCTAWLVYRAARAAGLSDIPF